MATSLGLGEHQLCCSYVCLVSVLPDNFAMLVSCVAVFTEPDSWM